ncbi:hypothetical protein [Rhizobium leguminosarum]|uniref:hypothetical protein n=1 Tax=Rhizobium leguminosarum TaxID=384 RepID=UPI001C93A3E2|nr:hypothetical protein [Rhizobium leguminosarum]MBY5714725.1 hypothetical protein [Rhizobium leguminosarum]
MGLRAVAGGMLDDLVPEDLVRSISSPMSRRIGQVSAALDAVKDKWGKKTLLLAS